MATPNRLFDAYDRPVTLAALRQEHAAAQVAGVRQVWAETVEGGLTPQRLAALLQRAAAGDHPVNRFGLAHVDRYRAYLAERKLSVASINIRLQNLKTFLRWASTEAA